MYKCYKSCIIKEEDRGSLHGGLWEEDQGEKESAVSLRFSEYAYCAYVMMKLQLNKDNYDYKY